MQADKKNMERMIEVVPNFPILSGSLQNILCYSPWSERGLLDQLARDANDHIGGDAFYGDDPELLRQLDQLGETFMLDFHKDQPIYLEDPAPYIPQRKSTRGKTPTRLKTDQRAVEVGQWAEQQPKSAWEKMLVRNSTKGFISARVVHRQVWLWDGEEQQAHKWHLVVSDTNMSKNNRKYSLSNARSDTPIQQLVYMQSQRYWVERAIEDGKSHAGLADYHLRSWTSWHHHMAMVMLALLFMY